VKPRFDTSGLFPASKAGPAKKKRVAMGKRLIARLVEYLESGGQMFAHAKICLYVDASGQYFVRGEKVKPEEAFLIYLVRKFEPIGCGHVKEDFIDQREIAKLFNLVRPRMEKKSSDDDNEGEEWKNGAEG
jgi:hypothetical protein